MLKLKEWVLPLSIVRKVTDKILTKLIIYGKVQEKLSTKLWNLIQTMNKHEFLSLKDQF